MAREELQRLCLRYLAETKFFSRGVFQGGTAIRLLYGGARFSEDLDFVFREKNDPGLASLATALRGLPAFVLRQAPYCENAALEQQKDAKELSRFRLSVRTPAKPKGLAVHLEFADVPGRRPRARLLRVGPVDVPIIVEDEVEILADKLVALALRDYIKGRDLWDIAFLVRERGAALPPSSLLSDKARDYGYPKAQLISKLAARLPELEVEGLQALRAEMKRFLPQPLLEGLTGSYEATLDAVSNAVREALASLGTRS
ncbi:MAG: nucleotidyl transferase AbiEii/AbiGii toxin family protein [Deltaproteobacteria bacterium]|nr:nucleotidyl transferase AbiEii/AbiGii toxin family protein [Deltaproteobacteria bacterium]